MIAALAILLATVTGNPPPAVYTCTGGTIYTIPFPYLATSQILAQQKTAAGVVTTVGGTVKPSIAPASGTLTLATACPTGSTLTISRVVPFTQPQSFRTNAYSGPVHEQAFDRLEMQVQQNAAALAALTTKEAADIAAAINPTPVTVNSNSLILATGATTSRTLAAMAADAINVKGSGAVGDGTVDDTTAINNAATLAEAAGKALYFPSGDYKVTSTILRANLKGIHWYGDGPSRTRILATTALTGLPVIKWQNVRDSTLEGMTISGAPAAPAMAAVEFNSKAGGAVASTRNLLRNVRLGEDVPLDNGIQYGIRFTASLANGSVDIAGGNNDLHTIRDSKISSFTVAGISIEHNSALLERIDNVILSYGPTGILAKAGSFNAHQIWQINISGTEYLIGDGSGGTFGTHPVVIDDCNSESNSQTAVYPRILQTGTEAGIEVVMTKYDRQGSATTLTPILFQSAGRLIISNSRINLGQAAQILSATSTTSTVMLIGNLLGFTNINVAGKYVAFANYWYSSSAPIEAIDQSKDFFTAAHLVPVAAFIGGHIKSSSLTLGRVAADETNNLYGSVTITDPALSATVTLPVAQSTNSYTVFVSSTTASGAPVAASFNAHVDNKTATTFLVILGAAPAAGAAVTVNWLLVR